MQTKYIIVGQGLAGSMLAYEFLKRGEDFIIIDDEDRESSSRVALGAYTPVYGKRMVVSEEIIMYLETALKIYRELENVLNRKLVFPYPIYQAFASEAEKSDFNTYSGQRLTKNYINKNPKTETCIYSELGAYEISGSGVLNCSTLIREFRDLFVTKNYFHSEVFNYKNLSATDNDCWLYNNIHAEKIIFCEGYKCMNNPFFKWIPFTPSRGVLLDINCKKLATDKIYKKGISLIPIDKGIFRAGSTYERDDISSNSDTSGLLILKNKLEKMLNTDYEIIGQSSGIRPGTRDRNPVLGEHPTHNNLYIMNGFGSRGVLLAPYFAALFNNFVNKLSEIPPEFALKRYVTHLFKS